MANISSQHCQPWLLSITRMPPISRQYTSSMPISRLNSLTSSFLCASMREVLEEVDALGRALDVARIDRSRLAGDENIFIFLSRPMPSWV